MINDDERDYAEEAYNRDELRREAEQEAAHEEVRDALVEALRVLAAAQQEQATRLLVGTAQAIDARAHLGPSHLTYLARAAEVAHLAGQTARAAERTGTYALGAQVERTLLDHANAASGRTSPGAGHAYEVALFAIRQVRDTARRVLGNSPEAAGLPGTTLTGAAL